MLKKWSVSGIFFILLAGCVMAPSDETERGGDFNPHPTSHENSQSGNGYVNDYGRDVQKKLSTNDMDSYTNPSTTDTTQRISEELMKDRDIIMSEVHEDEDRIYVAVKLRENNHDRSHSKSVIPGIENRVRNVTGNDDKQIVVLTDHIEWNELKNEASTPEIIKRFNEFFDWEEGNQ